MKRNLIIILLLAASTSIQAQILHPVSWSYGAKKINKKEAVLFLRATIEDGWHIYSQKVADGGPVKTSFTFKPGKGYILEGKITEPKPIRRFEEAFHMEVSFFEHEVIFQQKIKLAGSGPVIVTGNLEYMTCNDKQCLPPDDITFSIPVK